MSTATATRTTKTATRKPGKTIEEKKAQAEALHASISDQVEALRDSARWTAFLDFAQAFHAYSLNNVLLIRSLHGSRGTGARCGAGADGRGGRRAFLVREYGSEEALEREIRRGRPRLGSAPRGASPSVRTRLSDADYAEFQRLVGETGKSQSDLVREGVRLLLEQHRVVS